MLRNCGGNTQLTGTNTLNPVVNLEIRSNIPENVPRNSQPEGNQSIYVYISGELDTLKDARNSHIQSRCAGK